MGKLTIPERFRAGVSAIRSLSEQETRAIKESLDLGAQQSQSLEARKDEIVVTAVASASGPDRSSDLKLIAEALTALYSVRSSREMSIEEFANDVAEALEELPDEHLRLPSGERDDFKRKLVLLLGADFFTVVSKSVELRSEHERTFCHARIITDLRPVFGSVVEDGPKAMIVMHHLRLAYHEGDHETRDFYVSLEAEDLRTLRLLIDRAEAKARGLKGNVRANMPLLGVPKE